MKMLDKILGVMVERVFGSYFKRIRDDLAQIHERLDYLEKKPAPITFVGPPFQLQTQPQLVPNPYAPGYVGRQPCPICRSTDCYQTHVIC